MPRANRYVEPGRTYHITHRCHDRSFLFRFAIDRQTYRTMMRERLPRYGIGLLSYCITSNHTHLLLRVGDGRTESLSRFMQSLEGDFAQYYNVRKKRQGAFWSDRYHAVMIQDGAHLRRCLAYIDLNMVRAGAVEHPSEWEWTGYGELVGQRRRNRLIDRQTLCRALDVPYPAGLEGFRESHRAAVEDAINRRELQRQAYWTESIAVGEREWVEDVASRVSRRMRVYIDNQQTEDTSVWHVREQNMPYGIAMDEIPGSKIAPYPVESPELAP